MKLASFPRFPLTITPTPLQRALNLEMALGDRSPRIYLKRDDLNGLAFGGNKARKLEYLVAAALAEGATMLVTEGAAQSNHARLTAAAAALAGLKCTLVLDTRRGADVQGNLLLDKLLAADVVFASTREERRARMTTIGEELTAKGERPYIIPTGGSVPLGALGYVAAMDELNNQLVEIGERPARLYFGTGSQGTQAGIAVGSIVFDVPFKPLGIAVEDTERELSEQGLPLAQATADLIEVDHRIGPDDYCIDDAFVGPGYAFPTTEGIEAIRLVAKTEAVFLEPVYTAKAMAGMIAHIRAGHFQPNESVVFLHTGGGPSIFANAESLAE
ncbi:MAG: D-cysteine desulfhydrase family protein [Thermomicrobiales bacterium]